MELQLEAIWRIIGGVFDDQNWIYKFIKHNDENIEVNRMGKRITNMWVIEWIEYNVNEEFEVSELSIGEVIIVQG